MQIRKKAMTVMVIAFFELNLEEINSAIYSSFTLRACGRKSELR